MATVVTQRELYFRRRVDEQRSDAADEAVDAEAVRHAQLLRQGDSGWRCLLS